MTGAPLVPAQIGDLPFGSWWTAEGVDTIRLAQQDVLLAPQPAGGLVPGPVLYDIDLAPGWHPETDAQSAAVADRWTAAIRTGVLGADPARSPVLACRGLRRRDDRDGDLQARRQLATSPARRAVSRCAPPVRTWR